MNQAAREPASAPAARSVLKYRSRVLTAASRTKWQSEQVSKWRLISPSTDVESRPSKYQQIKGIESVSRFRRGPSALLLEKITLGVAQVCRISPQDPIAEALPSSPAVLGYASPAEDEC